MVEVNLGYFKQGDDLNGFLRDGSDKSEAFHEHARLLKDCAAHLHSVGVIIEKYQGDFITIDADTHCIAVDGPEKMLQELLDEELAVELGCGCEECNEE